MDASTYKSTVLVRIRKAHLADLTNGIAEMNRGADFPSTIDLALVYAIEPQMSDAEIAARIREVRNWWNANTGRSNVMEVAKFCRALDALLAAEHADLTRRSFWQRWESQRSDRSRAVLDQLAVMLDHQYRDFGVITLAQVRAAAATNSLTGRLSDADLTAAIGASESLTLVEEFRAPAIQIPGPVRREWNSTADLRSFMDAIYVDDRPSDFRLIGGFAAPDRRPPTAQTLRDALRACDKRAGVEVESIKKLLHALSDAHGKGFGLADLTLVQMVEFANEALQGGIIVLAIQTLVDKGLDRTDAARVVMHCADTTTTQGGRDTPQRVLELLADGRLRAARTVYTALAGMKAHADTEELAEALRSLARNEEQVIRLRADADRALEQGQVTVATELLSQAYALAEDDEPLARLVASLPPAPPATLTVTPADGPAGAGRAVRLLWSASPGADRDTTYVVVRKTGAAPRDIRDGTQISSAPSTEAVDPNPPVAEQLWYAVAARRGGRPSPVTTARTVLLPPVADVTVTSDATSVTLRWTTPRDAARVAVTRTDAAGHRTQVSPSGPDSLVARGLRTSEKYTFELVAEYQVASGGTATSAPVRVGAVPRQPAKPVERLEVRSEGVDGGRIEVTAEWTALIGQDVEVWQFPSKPVWAFGSEVGYSALEAAGGVRLLGTPQRRGSWVRMAASVPSGLRHYLAVTPDQAGTLIGRATSLAICEPVGDPHVERFGELAVVSWNWPRADYRVHAEWSAGNRRGSTRVSRPEYVRDGGLRITVGPAAATIRLSSVLESADGRWTSPEVVLTLDGTVLSARYRLLWPRAVIGRGPLRIEFAADTPVHGVTVTAHVHGGAYLPQRSAAETVAQRIPLEIPAGEVQVVEVTLPKIRKPYWVRCFAESPQTLTLVDPPSDNLKGR